MASKILRPLEYGDILDELFDLYKSKFLVLTGIAAVVYFPIYMTAYSLLESEIANIAVMLLSLPLSLFVAGASTWAVSQSYLGHEVSIVSAYKAVFRIGVPFFLTMFAVVILLCIGLVMCIAPGVLLWLVVAFTPHILLVENIYYADTFKRGWALADGQWGRIFVISIIVYIMYSVISSILAMPFMIPLFIAGMDFSNGGNMPYYVNVLTGFGSALSYSISVPIIVIPFVLLYYDIRVRKEGFDIEMLALSMGVEAPKQPFSPYTASSVPTQTFTPGTYNPDTADKDENPYQQG